MRELSQGNQPAALPAAQFRQATPGNQPRGQPTVNRTEPSACSARICFHLRWNHSCFDPFKAEPRSGGLTSSACEIQAMNRRTHSFGSNTAMTQLGTDTHTYQLIRDFLKPPPGQSLGVVSRVGTDSQDRVYVFQRKD